MMGTDEPRVGARFRDQMFFSDTIWVSVGWYLVAMLCLVSVLVINGAPLYYFDTGGYLVQGRQFLEIVGVVPAQIADISGAGGGPEAAADDTVQGSRSLIYGIWLSLFQAFANLSAVVVVQSAVLVLTIWMSVRVVLRTYDAQFSSAAVTGVSVIAASLGSAPFYTAFLMPDIFAPVLILSMAALTAFIGSLRTWEIIVFWLLATVSVVMHPSHLLMVLLFFPIAPISAFLSGRRHVLLATVLAGSVALVGVVERFAFTFAAEKVAESEVVYRPFLTARLIVDGPGLDYLEEVCPEAKLATCDLISMFVRPYQVTASHIVFETTEELGSFTLLPEDTQRLIVQEQIFLLREVIRTRPFGLVRAVMVNTLEQVARMSVHMTLPDDVILKNLNDVVPDAAAEFASARLTDWQSWSPDLLIFHKTLYAASALILLIASFWRASGLRWEFRVFVWLTLYGMATNALILGALSQPADRYGARVSFLLPVLAAMVLFRWWHQASSRSTDALKKGRPA